MKIFETNSGLGYRNYVYLIKIDAVKNKSKYLCIGSNFYLYDNGIYSLGEGIEMEDYEVELTNSYKIEQSPLFGTFLFNFFLQNYSNSVAKDLEKKEKDKVLLSTEFYETTAEGKRLDKGFCIKKYGSGKFESAVYQLSANNEELYNVMEKFIKNHPLRINTNFPLIIQSKEDVIQIAKDFAKEINFKPFNF